MLLSGETTRLAARDHMEAGIMGGLSALPIACALCGSGNIRIQFTSALSLW